jgi:hypothetical protein
VQSSSGSLLLEGFNQARAELQELAFLSSDWNSYGSARPTFETRKSALHLIEKFESTSLPSPRVNPSADGGVAIEFRLGTQKAILEILNSGEFVAGTYSTHGPTEAWEFDLTTVDQTIERIRNHLS